MSTCLKVAITTMMAVLAVLFGSDALGTASPPYTASQDAAYVQTLMQRGVPCPGSAQPEAIALGRNVAQTLYRQPTEGTVTRITTTLLNSAHKAGLDSTTTPAATTFAAAVLYSAVSAYEPSLWPVLKAWADDATQRSPLLSSPVSCSSLNWQSFTMSQL